jgi:hypothetical protein
MQHESQTQESPEFESIEFWFTAETRGYSNQGNGSLRRCLRSCSTITALDLVRGRR